MPFRGQPGDEPEAFCHGLFFKGGNLWWQVRDQMNLHLRSILPDGVRNISEVPRDLAVLTVGTQEAVFDPKPPFAEVG